MKLTQIEQTIIIFDAFLKTQLENLKKLVNFNPFPSLSSVADNKECQCSNIVFDSKTKPFGGGGGDWGGGPLMQCKLMMQQRASFTCT